MKIKGLTKKTSLVVIIPLLIGVALIRASSIIPTYIQYTNMLETYADNMISNQKTYMKNSSFLLSKIASVNYIQHLCNSVNIAGDLMQLYYFYGLRVKPGFNYSSNLCSYNEYLEKYPTYPILYNQSLWFCHNASSYNEVNQSVQVNLNASSVFDPILRVVSILAHKYLGFSYLSSYFAFSSNGLYYRSPSSAYLNFSSNACQYSSDNWYDPRCSYFYNKTLTQKGISNAVIIEPYTYDSSDSYGQTICRAQWNYTNSNMVMMFCIDFNSTNKFYFSHLYTKHSRDKTYNYIANNKGIILQYKNGFNGKYLNKTINFLEIHKEEEREKYNKTIMPLFLYQSQKLAHYTKEKSKMIASISPIMMTLSNPASPYHYASVALVMKNEILENKFNDLKSTCSQDLKIENIIGACIVLIISIFCVYVTFALSKSLIAPIDDLVIILNRMLEGDLEVDILASRKPCPVELQDLYEVFDKLRVVLRFTNLHMKDLTQASLVYSQALNLFISFGNHGAMEICYRELGYIFEQKELWAEAASYLYSALRIYLDVSDIDKKEYCRRTIEVSNAMVKSGVYYSKGFDLLNEAYYKARDLAGDNEVTEILINLAEIAYEGGVKEECYYIELIDLIGKFNDNGVVEQRFLYIKALYLKNNFQYKECCKHISILLEQFPIYLPVIRMKAINLLKEISSSDEVLSVSRFSPSEKPVNKDIVLIVSSSCIDDDNSDIIKSFVKSVINPNDRLGLIECYSQAEVLFNLTKLPLNIMEFKNVFDVGNEFRLFDAIQKAVRQIEIKNYFSHLKSKRQSWIIVITDNKDNGSSVSLSSLKSSISQLAISQIFVDLSNSPSDFYYLSEDDDFSQVYEVPNYSYLKSTLKEVEAYLCTEKEVFDSNLDCDELMYDY